MSDFSRNPFFIPVLKILYVSSEAYPLIKTGGLGDVAGSLPAALQAQGHDVVLIMPGYREVLDFIARREPVSELDVYGGRARLLQGRFPATQVKIWLVDAPPLFDRPGNPYLDSQGYPWGDNAQRFALFARVAVALAQDRAGISWKPDVVHCNDWQCGLVPALLKLETQRLTLETRPPAIVFTIHNLAYQGLYPFETFVSLGLPHHLWSYEALEFYGQLSFMKGGLVFSDRITTVSPTYAREIQTTEFGAGLDKLLTLRRAVLSGILNGIDDRQWDPSVDGFIAHRYSADTVQEKAINKADLHRIAGFSQTDDKPLIAMIGRLVEQKGIDLVLEILPRLIELPVRIVILGTGQASYERMLQEWSGRYPDRMKAYIGFDEKLAHQIEAGADILLMPSRFEPCGLNQMYSLRYGTVPVVRRTGGLADTVVDTSPQALRAGLATGVSFSGTDGNALLEALERALALYEDKPLWRKLQQTGMQQDFSWQRSATEYLNLYRLALQERVSV